MKKKKVGDSLEIKLNSKENKKEGVDILILVQEAIRKMQESELVEKKGKENIEKKAKIKKKDDDISIVIDDEDKTDEDWDDVLQISVDMDGFDKFHLDQYAKQVEQYQRMLAEYLEGSSTYSAVNMYETYLAGEEAEINKDEMMSFDELQDTLEQIKWNNVAGQENNYIHPDMKESLALWSLFSYNRMKMQLWKISGDGSATFCGLNMY